MASQSGRSSSSSAGDSVILTKPCKEPRALLCSVLLKQQIPIPLLTAPTPFLCGLPNSLCCGVGALAHHTPAALAMYPSAIKARRTLPLPTCPKRQYLMMCLKVATTATNPRNNLTKCCLAKSGLVRSFHTNVGVASRCERCPPILGGRRWKHGATCQRSFESIPQSSNLRFSMSWSDIHTGGRGSWIEALVHVGHQILSNLAQTLQGRRVWVMFAGRPRAHV